MRKLLRAIFAAMGRIVIRTVRLASGVMMTFVEMLRPATPPVDYADDVVDDAAERDQAAFDRDADEEGLREVGGLIRQAAAEIVQHGQVVSGSIPVGIRNYVSGLGRDALTVLLASDPVDVGLHVRGSVVLRDAQGFSIRRPDRERDAKRAAERLEEIERREAAYRRPSRRTAALDPSLARSLVPGL